MRIEDDIDHKPFEDLHDKSNLIELIVHKIQQDIYHLHKAVVQVTLEVILPAIHLMLGVIIGSKR